MEPKNLVFLFTYINFEPKSNTNYHGERITDHMPSRPTR